MIHRNPEGDRLLRRSAPDGSHQPLAGDFSAVAKIAEGDPVQRDALRREPGHPAV